MWISRKRLTDLEKRVTDLEKAQSKSLEVSISPLAAMKVALKETLCQAPQQCQTDIEVR